MGYANTDFRGENLFLNEKIEKLGVCSNLANTIARWVSENHSGIAI